jgi:hypothetical protein
LIEIKAGRKTADLLSGIFGTVLIPAFLHFVAAGAFRIQKNLFMHEIAIASGLTIF